MRQVQGAVRAGNEFPVKPGAPLLWRSPASVVMGQEGHGLVPVRERLAEFDVHVPGKKGDAAGGKGFAHGRVILASPVIGAGSDGGGGMTAHDGKHAAGMAEKVRGVPARPAEKGTDDRVKTPVNVSGQDVTELRAHVSGTGLCRAGSEAFKNIPVSIKGL